MVWGGDPIFLKTSTCNPPHPAWVYQFWPLNRKKKKKKGNPWFRKAGFAGFAHP